MLSGRIATIYPAGSIVKASGGAGCFDVAFHGVSVAVVVKGALRAANAADLLGFDGDGAAFWADCNGIGESVDSKG